MKRTAALLLLAATLARAEGGPLPGEQLLGPGQLAPLPADARVVPGYAGTWRRADSQERVRDRIVELEGRRAKPCTDVRVTDTEQAAPDLAETRPTRIHHALERWTVRACGATRSYEVWYRFAPGASRVAVAESGGGRFQGELDPPYRRLLELAAAHPRDADAGADPRRWLNLPLPEGWHYASQSGGLPGQDWRTDFLPVGPRLPEWTDLISVQGLPRRPATGQARLYLEGLQASRQTRCGAAPEPIEALPADDATGRARLRTLLICPQVPGTDYAELALVQALEGPDILYVVQRAWRLPAADADSLRRDSADVLKTGAYFLSLVRLCPPATRMRDCPAPFPADLRP